VGLADKIEFRKALFNLSEIDLENLSIDRHEEPKNDFEIAYCIFRDGVREQIKEFYGEWPEQIRRKFFLKGFQDPTMQMITIDNEVIGCFCITEQENSVILQRMYLKEEFQGEGIGLKLMNMALEKAHELEKPLELEVLTNNKRAIKVYSEHGFEIFNTLERQNRSYEMRHKDTEQYLTPIFNRASAKENDIKPSKAVKSKKDNTPKTP